MEPSPDDIKEFQNPTISKFLELGFEWCRPEIGCRNLDEETAIEALYTYLLGNKDKLTMSDRFYFALLGKSLLEGYYMVICSPKKLPTGELNARPSFGLIADGVWLWFRRNYDAEHEYLNFKESNIAKALLAQSHTEEVRSYLRLN